VTKSDFRTECLKQHKNLSNSGKSYRNGRINHHLLKILRHQKGKRILFYWPFGFEADIRPTILALRPKNSLYLPLMDDVSFKMVPLRYPLERRSFGIYEPRNSNLNLKLIDIAIVPVVGVDATGARIGFGKGMYDRFFPTLKRKPLTIFVQSRRCVSSLSLCDDYDVKGDLFVTPDGVRSSKDFYVKHSSRQWWHSHTGRGNRIFNF
jgi:5-formyltetrahydrofolate cyclo-ligase